MAMGPRDEYKSNYRDPTTGLRWALAVVSVVAVAAVIAAVTLWLKPRHVEQAPPAEKASSAAPTGVARADLEQITGQMLVQKFPGPPVRITCPDDLPAKVGATEDCVLRRFGEKFHLTVNHHLGHFAHRANWRYTLSDFGVVSPQC